MMAANCCCVPCTQGPKNTPVPPGTAAPVPHVAVEDFAYFKVYDYDLFWNTDDDNVLAGAYAGTTVSVLPVGF